MTASGRYVALAKPEAYVDKAVSVVDGSASHVLTEAMAVSRHQRPDDIERYAPGPIAARARPGLRDLFYQAYRDGVEDGRSWS